MRVLDGPLLWALLSTARVISSAEQSAIPGGEIDWPSTEPQQNWTTPDIQSTRPPGRQRAWQWAQRKPLLPGGLPSKPPAPPWAVRGGHGSPGSRRRTASSQWRRRRRKQKIKAAERQDIDGGGVTVVLFGSTTQIPARVFNRLVGTRRRNQNIFQLLTDAVRSSLLRNQDIGVIIPWLSLLAVAAAAAAVLQGQQLYAQKYNAVSLSSGRALEDDAWDVNPTLWMDMLRRDFERSWDANVPT